MLADTGEVKDNQEKKHLNIDTIMNAFLAVEKMKTVLMGLAMVVI